MKHLRLVLIFLAVVLMMTCGAYADDDKSKAFEEWVEKYTNPAYVPSEVLRYSKPIVYTDTESGVSFELPTDWEEAPLSEPREYVDAKFVSEEEPGMSIIYASGDIWGEMTSDEKAEYSRVDIDNEMLTNEDISNIFSFYIGAEIDASDAKLMTIGGNKFFVVKLPAVEHELYDDLEVDIALAINITNGYVHFFQCMKIPGTGLLTSFELMGGDVTPSITGYSDLAKFLFNMSFPTVENEVTPVNDALDELTIESDTTDEPVPASDTTDESVIADGVQSVLWVIVVFLAAVLVIVLGYERARRKKTKYAQPKITSAEDKETTLESENVLLKTTVIEKNGRTMLSKLVKFLIWLCCGTIYGLITLMFNYQGITLGGIPTSLLAAVCIFVPAPKLCKKWDSYKKNRSE